MSSKTWPLGGIENEMTSPAGIVVETSTHELRIPSPIEAHPIFVEVGVPSINTLLGMCLAPSHRSESARGLAQSKTLRAAQRSRNWRQLLDCASPLALLR